MTAQRNELILAQESRVQLQKEIQQSIQETPNLKTQLEKCTQLIEESKKDLTDNQTEFISINQDLQKIEKAVILKSKEVN